MSNKSITMSFNDISPFLRYANLLQCSPEDIFGPRMIYDHQFVYVCSGKGIIKINDTSYEAIPGDVFFYGPGIIHTIISDKYNPFVLLGFHFDFTRNHSSKLFPIGSFAIENFDSKLITETIVFNDFYGFPNRMNLAANDKISKLAQEIVDEYENQRKYSHAHINGLFLTWVSLIARHITAAQDQVSFSEELVQKVLEYIHLNYNKQLTNTVLGKQFHFHPNYLNKLLIAHTGVSLRQYIINLRMKKAIDFLIHSSLSISEISRAVGYEDVHYFSRIFKSKTGIAPSLIKKRL